MFRAIVIRSRAGNVVLAAAGTAFAVAGLALLIAYLSTTWGATSLVDRLLQMVLLAVSATGLVFIHIARTNLTHHHG